MESYEILEKLGEGAMGVVYRATQTSLGREVAVKLVLDRDGAPAPAAAARFLREVRCIARISHPNVIRVIDYGQLDGRPFYAMEYLKHSVPLDRVIKRGRLPLARVYAIARGLLEALEEVHAAGMVHRDLKPGNVMIDEADHVTLMDFGLVKDLEASPLTKVGSIVGTPRYLAPEALRGKGVDQRSDLFALGALLFEALTGRLLHGGANLSEIMIQICNTTAARVRESRPEVPEWLDALIARLLEKPVESRYQSADEALRDLCAGLGAERLRAARARRAPASDPEELALEESRVVSGLDLLRAGVAAWNESGETPSPAEPPRRPRTGRSPVVSRPHAEPAPRPSSATGPGRIPGTSDIRSSRDGRAAAWRAPVATRIWSFGAVAALLGGLAAAGLLSLPRAGTTIATPTATSAPSVETAIPAVVSPTTRTPREVLRAAHAALRGFDPRRRITDLHSLLWPIRQKWFKQPPVPELVALRDSYRGQLETAAAAASLDQRLGELAAARDACFGDAVPAAEKHAAWLALHDLLDLEIYCESFGVIVRRQALGAFSERYGQLAAPQLADQPACGIELRAHPDAPALPPSTEASAHLQRLLPADGSARFQLATNADESDIYTSLGERKDRTVYEHPQPLDIPLESTAALELSGWAWDMWPNAAFEIELSDGAAYQKVAVVRARTHAKLPARWWHTVDRALFTGTRLRLRVRLRLIPDINASCEAANLARVLVHYQPR